GGDPQSDRLLPSECGAHGLSAVHCPAVTNWVRRHREHVQDVGRGARQRGGDALGSGGSTSRPQLTRRPTLRALACVLEESSPAASTHCRRATFCNSCDRSSVEKTGRIGPQKCAAPWPA